MKNLIATSALILLVCLVVAPAFAQSKPCDELKTEIAAKLDAKSVSGYQLEIVKTKEVKNRRWSGAVKAARRRSPTPKEDRRARQPRQLLRLQSPQLRRNLLPQNPTNSGRESHFSASLRTAFRKPRGWFYQS